MQFLPNALVKSLLLAVPLGQFAVRCEQSQSFLDFGLPSVGGLLPAANQNFAGLFGGH